MGGQLLEWILKKFELYKGIINKKAMIRAKAITLSNLLEIDRRIAR